MSLPKACIFDLDGVIVDTVPSHYVAWKAMADELGIPFSEEENEQLKGVSRVDSMKKILAIGGIEKSDDEVLAYTNKKNKIYVELISKMTEEDILPGVTDFIENLKSNGVEIAIGSSSKNTPTILKAVGLEDTFKVVVDGNSVEHSKPNPEVFLKGAHQLGFAPEDCVVLEDAISGVEAAKRGKMKCIGIGSPEVLSEADLVVPNLENQDISIFSQL